MKKFLLSIFAVMLAVFSVQAQEASWQMVTNASTLKAGDKIVIVAKDSDKAIGKEQANNNRKSAAVNKNGNTVSWTAYVQEITLETGTVDGTFAFYVEGSTGKATKGYLYAASSSSNYLKTQTSNNANGCWEIKIAADGIATIKAKGTNSRNLLKYNKSSDLFSCYSSGQNDVCIYKYTLPGEEGGDEPVVTPPAAPTLPESTSFTEDEFVVEIINNADNAIVYYSLNNENDWVEGSTVTIDETTTVYAKAVDADDETNESEVVSAKYTKTVVIEGGIEDVLDLALTGIASGETGYSSWVDKSSKSSAVYAGQSAGGNGAIQLRSNNSNSGIVTTASGGKVKKIVVDWNSNTAAGRILEIYGKNTPYTNPTELYATTGNTEQGEKLGTIECGVSSELVIEGDYEYIGLRSYTGAMYLNWIEITWVVEEEEPVAESWSSFYAAFPVAIPAGVEAYIVTAANGSYVTLEQIYNAVPAYTGVILKGGSIEATYDNYYTGEVTEVTGNLLNGTMSDTYIYEEAYVLGKVDGNFGFYKAAMNQLDGTAWLANAGKAYLPVSALPASAQGAASFSFRFEEGTTGISEVKGENGEVKAIFDLTGRRVEAITAPGIYVVNGKKVLVK